MSEFSPVTRMALPKWILVGLGISKSVRVEPLVVGCGKHRSWLEIPVGCRRRSVMRNLN